MIESKESKINSKSYRAMERVVLFTRLLIEKQERLDMAKEARFWSYNVAFLGKVIR